MMRSRYLQTGSETGLRREDLVEDVLARTKSDERSVCLRLSIG